MILLATIYSDILNRYCCIISQENLAACCQNSRLSTPNIFSFLTGFNGKHCIFCNVSYYNGACFFVINQGKCISANTAEVLIGCIFTNCFLVFRKCSSVVGSWFLRSSNFKIRRNWKSPSIHTDTILISFVTFCNLNS